MRVYSFAGEKIRLNTKKDPKMPHKNHNYEKESEKFYDNIAQRFDHSFDGFLASFFKKFIVKHLEVPRNANILDIGCANGTLLSMISKQKAIFGAGLDISSEMVKIASQRHPQFDFKQGSAEAVPFPKDNFDIITCSASFHHFPHPDRFLDEASRLLKQDGRLVIAEIHIPIVTKLYNWRLNRFSTEGDVKVYHPKELANLFQKKGWKIVKRKIFLQIQYYELKKL
ncbi:2-methoxy-6-polyprenyl-1,4-benzoquinol methylase, mitochondrial [Lactococcus petauri]|nr:2-methoxy-6-polyprenyl-1,4-benzoquinol methylase, mitochondrial [Lactococcus petauri]MDC7843262.1 2-methoxy-6-polyprenyl-1,4-benzoquinol methylase, mitochondrial [Lactococcus petauri]MDC7845170.1 2-methoxy-6-polyprenyl-1,4-benzoquinol methylase, mitochondrial [Lactococcus petauri]